MMRKKQPWKRDFDLALGRLKDAGIIDKIIMDVVRLYHDFAAEAPEPKLNFERMQFDYYWSLVWLYCLGVGIAFVSLIMEIVLNKFK